MKFPAIARNINRTLDVVKGRGAVGLFLAIVRGGGLAAAVRDVVGQVRVHLQTFAAGSGIPNGWLAAPQTNSVIGCGVDHARRRTVAIALVEFCVALRVKALS